MSRKLSGKRLLTVSLIALLSVSMFIGLYNISFVKAQSEPTLADTINEVVNHVEITDSPWTVLYSQIFGLRNASVFDDAITNALNQNDTLSVFFIARLVEINGYSSSIINNTIITALEQGVPTFTMYDRYMPSAYRYAENFNVSGWNATSLATQVENVVPALYLYQTGSSQRYYDEYAESISMLLELNHIGFNTTSQMADIWENTQDLWNMPFDTIEGNPVTPQLGYYQYSSLSNEIECEMGNFAQIITEYQNQVGSIPYFSNVITDLETKLLAKQFQSGGWGTVGAIKHSTFNGQLRLGETLGSMIALQMLYPYFSQVEQSNFQNMQLTMWKGLISSGLYSNGQFSTNTGYGDITPSNDATSIGAMTLFLDGIIPQTGYLAINASEIRYHDYRTCFPISQWKFNYQTQSIRIPIVAGNLAFIFGSQQVTQTFPEDGVYDIQFSNDWNSIISITKIDNIYGAQKITQVKTPLPTNTPAVNSPSTPTATPQPTATTQPTTTPTPSPSQTQIQTPTPAPTQTIQEPQVQVSKATITPEILLACAFLIGVGTTITILCVVKLKRKQKI